MEINKTSLDTVCSTLCYAMGITPPEESAQNKRNFGCIYR